MKDRLEQLKAVRHPPTQERGWGWGWVSRGGLRVGTGSWRPHPRGCRGVGGSSNPRWWRMGMSQEVVVTKPPPHGGVLGVGGHGDTHTPAAMVHMGVCVCHGDGGHGGMETPQGCVSLTPQGGRGVSLGWGPLSCHRPVAGDITGVGGVGAAQDTPLVVDGDPGGMGDPASHPHLPGGWGVEG